MLENLREMNRIRKNARENNKIEYDSDGREIIRMRVSDDSDFLSPYSYGDGSVISGDVAAFLDHAVKPMRLKNRLHIIIASSCIDIDEQSEYSSAVKNYYRNRVLDIDKKLHTNAVISLIMTVIAVAILTAYVILELMETAYVILAVTDITAWVFMWEAVDLFFLERQTLRIEQRHDLSLYNAKISYINENF